MVDKQYCMSSYLMYRYVFNSKKSFQENRNCNIVDLAFERVPIKTAEDLLTALEAIVKQACEDGRAALALSGGIDSAILAKLMPTDSKAYTFRCIVPGRKVIDESEQAKRWAKICGLNHKIVDIYWEDIVKASEILMINKGSPIHSIEAQIYIAAEEVKRDGAEKFIFGENADIIYGGMDGLLAKDWRYAEFIERYTYIMPYKVLRNPQLILEPYQEFEVNGYIDGHDFINKYFRQEALGTYCNACETAGIEFVGPYSLTYFDRPIDYARIRNGDSKYIVREAFRMLYPNEDLPVKIPMPRPMNEWLESWAGPARKEFISHSTDTMTGDQKWMVWALEKFLDIMERNDNNEEGSNRIHR